MPKPATTSWSTYLGHAIGRYTESEGGDSAETQNARRNLFDVYEEWVDAERPSESTVPSVAAVAYGRGVLEREVERLKGFEASALAKGDRDASERWGRLHKWLSWQVLGAGEGCVITAFDARWLDESFRSMMGGALRAPVRSS